MTQLRESASRGQMFPFCENCPPQLAKRGELTRRILRFYDCEERWRELSWVQKGSLAAWEAKAQFGGHGIRGALRTLFKKRGRNWRGQYARYRVAGCALRAFKKAVF